VTPRWTILIATIGRRGPSLRRLLDQLLPQADAAGGQVTIEALWNNGERSLGQVRDDLLHHAASEYVSFCDDDDEVPPYLVESVLPLLDGDVHYIGWRMRCYWLGGPMKPTWHSLRYGGWREDDHAFYRDISHLNPVRRDLTAGTTFRGGWPEDRSWADQMRGRLLTEKFAGEELYHYRFSPDDTIQAGLRPAEGGPHARLRVDSPWFSWHPASSR